jgi:outer membrane biosynthesis protein TonB
MGRLTASLLPLVLGLAAALALASCGGGDSAELLPGDTANQIDSNLDQVEQLAAAGDCLGAEDAAREVADQVEGLNGVDAELKRALRQGAARLNEVVASCNEAPPEEEEETVEPLEETEAERELEAEEEQEEKEEEREKPEKPEKPEKTEEEAPKEDEQEESEGPTLPPTSNGKGEEKGGGPAVEPPSPNSGGVGPGAPVGEG